LVQEHRDDFGSEYEAIKAIAGRLGMNPETVRKWLRQAEVEAGQVDGTTTAAAREIRELKRKNAELEQTVAILKAATSFNACGESARNTDHLYSRRRASCSGRGRADLPRAESAWLPDRPRTFFAWARRAPSQRDLWDIVITEILAGYYEPDELVLAPLSGSCSPLCSRL
jgi:transposase